MCGGQVADFIEDGFKTVPPMDFQMFDEPSTSSQTSCMKRTRECKKTSNLEQQATDTVYHASLEPRDNHEGSDATSSDSQNKAKEKGRNLIVARRNMLTVFRANSKCFDIADHLLDLVPEDLNFDYLPMLRRTLEEAETYPELPGIDYSTEALRDYFYQLARDAAISEHSRITPFISYSKKKGRYVNPTKRNDSKFDGLPEYLKHPRHIQSQLWQQNDHMIGQLVPDPLDPHTSQQQWGHLASLSFQLPAHHSTHYQQAYSAFGQQEQHPGSRALQHKWGKQQWDHQALSSFQLQAHQLTQQAYPSLLPQQQWGYPALLSFQQLIFPSENEDLASDNEDSDSDNEDSDSDNEDLASNKDSFQQRANSHLAYHPAVVGAAQQRDDNSASEEEHSISDQENQLEMYGESIYYPMRIRFNKMLDVIKKCSNEVEGPGLFRYMCGDRPELEELRDELLNPPSEEDLSPTDSSDDDDTDVNPNENDSDASGDDSDNIAGDVNFNRYHFGFNRKHANVNRYPADFNQDNINFNEDRINSNKDEAGANGDITESHKDIADPFKDNKISGGDETYCNTNISELNEDSNADVEYYNEDDFVYDEDDSVSNGDDVNFNGYDEDSDL